MSGPQYIEHPESAQQNILDRNHHKYSPGGGSDTQTRETVRAPKKISNYYILSLNCVCASISSDLYLGIPVFSLNFSFKIYCVQSDARPINQ